MVIKYKAYDHDRHCWLAPNEVRINAAGQVFYNNSSDPNMEIWEPLDENPGWLTIEKVIVLQNDDHPNFEKRA